MVPWSMALPWRPSGHPAAGAGIADFLLGDANDGIVAVLDLAQIDILHRVVRLGEAPFSARTFELDLFHGADQGFRRADVALHLVHGPDQKLGRVVALYC